MTNKNIPGNATPAPAKAEKKRDLRKEAEARSRARRMRSMMKSGMKPELIEEMFAQEENRMILVLLDGKYTVQDGMRTIKKYKRDKQHKVTSVEEKEVPNILRGWKAANKYVEDQKLHLMTGYSNAIWILSDKDHVDDAVEKLKVLGRVSITKPEPHTYDTEKTRIAKEKKTPKKPSNNTAEAKAAAKERRKANNTSKAEMRTYYAALRKGGVNARIKKYNPTLANKIEAWLKEHKKTEAEKAERMAKHRRNHRQMSSIEMKANKKARKEAKRIATQKRRKEAEKAAAEHNATARKKLAQKAQKPIQTELKMVA